MFSVAQFVLHILHNILAAVMCQNPCHDLPYSLILNKTDSGSYIKRVFQLLYMVITSTGAAQAVTIEPGNLILLPSWSNKNGTTYLGCM